MSWLNQNSGAVQAIMAVIIGLLTAALIAVTARYVKLTGRMVKAMERQLTAMFQPNINLGLANRFRGSGTHQGVAQENISGTVIAINKGTTPVRIVDITMNITFADNAFPAQKKIFDTAGRVLMPEEKLLFEHLAIDVPIGSTHCEYEQSVDFRCSDLARVNEHTFTISSDGESRFFPDSSKEH